MPQTNESVTLLKTAKDSIVKTASLFKTAAEGTLTPDQVKEFAMNAQQTLQSVDSVLATIIAKVPASEGEDETVIEEPSLEGAPKPPVPEGEEDERDVKIASLEKSIADIQLKTAKEKIATEYSALWPGKTQTAKFASIMKSSEPIVVLQAKLAEAQAILGNGKAKVASDWRSPAIYTDASPQKNASEKTISQRATSFLTV